MSYNLHSDLSNDISQLLEYGIDYNVVVQVGQDFEASNGQEEPVLTNKVPGREEPMLTNKVPGQEKPMPAGERTKMPGQEKTASMLLKKEQEAIQTFEEHEEIKGDF